MVSDQTGFVILLCGVFFQAAMGILTYAQDKLGVEESWYEKLHRWEDALAAYSTKAHSATSADELQSANLGRMRCLAALARWEELSILCRESWVPTEHSRCLEMAPMVSLNLKALLIPPSPILVSSRSSSLW
jgi:FKBP12-rapamycin complex-associated protein